jgi:general secretion pathway protein K
MMPDCPRATKAVEPGEAGYALVAAVAAILFFAVIALGILSLTQRVLVTGTAEVEAARASAAADAGIALALRGLAANGPENAFPIDGTLRRMRFETAELEIAVTDERGKVPLNLVDEEQLTALLEFAGLSGDPLMIARDSYLDWIDDDDEPRPDGAELDYYRPQGIHPRNAGFVTLGELGRVRGFTSAIVRKIASVATTDFGNSSFDVRSASPAAIRIMYPGGDAAVDEIVRSRETQGQVTALGFVDRRNRLARPLTISVRASSPSGAVSIRSCIVELTGAERRPYVIRHCV